MLDPNSKEIFTTFDTSSFDAQTVQAGGQDQRRRRESWPILRFSQGSSGNDEVSIRILPLPTVVSKGHWVKTKNNKTYWADCSAYDPHSQTSNGVCPICSFKIAPVTTKTIVYVIDKTHAEQLQQMGIGMDQYKAAASGQDKKLMILHPYRVFEMSQTMLNQINQIRVKKGSASDPATGYLLDIIKVNNNGKVDYQAIPGTVWPIDQSILENISKCGMPDIREYHEAEPQYDIVRSLYFNGHITQDQLVSTLQSYLAQGLVTQTAIENIMKSVATYQSKLTAVPGIGVAAGISAPAPLAAPSLPSAAPSALPPMGMPQVAPPIPQAAPVVPSAPSLPGLPGLPGLPSGIPGLPQIPSVPKTALNIPSAPIAGDSSILS